MPATGRIPQVSQADENRSQSRAAGAPASDSGASIVNVTAGSKRVEVGQQVPSDQELTIQAMQDQITAMRQKMGVLQAEKIELEMTASQMSSENEDLKAELSRTRMQLSRERAGKQEARKKYTELLKEMSMSPDDMMKELHQHRTHAMDLEQRLNTETGTMKKFFTDLNKQLAKENDQHVETMSKLSIKLEESNSTLARSKSEHKAAIAKLESKLEDALKDAQDARGQFETAQLEISKLQQAKAEQKITLEDKISKMSKSSRSLPAVEEDDEPELSTDQLLRMMSGQLGMDMGEDY